MTPMLFDSDERLFTDDIICYLGEAASCIVTEELNNIYECEFQYPVWGKYYSEIVEGRYICATHDDKGDLQPFEIYKRSAPIDGMVTFYAHHLSYKMSNVILNPIDGNSTTGLFTAIPGRCANACPFDFHTTRGGNKQFKTTVPMSLRAALMANKDSILSTYGGELTFNKWSVTLNTARGQDTDVTIRYGKNLTGLEQTIDIENLYNAVLPYWSGKVDGEETLIVPEGNPIIALAGVTEIKPVAKDFSGYFQTAPDPEDLEDIALDFLQTERPDVPKENIKVSFAHLWQTEEYKNVAALQRIGLGDKVSVIYPELGVVAENVEVIKTVYNTLTDRYENMELGQPKETFLSNVTEKMKEDIEEKVELGWTVFEERWRLALEELTYNMLHPGESHVVFYRGDVNASGYLENPEYGTGAMEDPAGILIMDTTDVSTAQHILMINKNGIAYSDHGINGVFNRGWDMSTGKFTTEYVNAWELMVNQIRLYGMMSVHENPQAVYVNGVLQDPIGGYIGYGRGSIGSGANDYTDGIMLSSTNNLDGTQVNNRFVIATTAGARMQAGNQTFYLLYDTVDGQTAGDGVLKVNGNLILKIGSGLKLLDGNTEKTGANATYTFGNGNLQVYRGFVVSGTGAYGVTGTEIQIGNANITISNGMVTAITPWNASSYQNDINTAASSGGSGSNVAVFG